MTDQHDDTILDWILAQTDADVDDLEDEVISILEDICGADTDD